VAEHWKAGKRSAEQERLFALLLGMLDDRQEQVRLQTAHSLFLLNDPRSEPGVTRVVNAKEERRPATTPLRGIRKVWLVGPFPDGPGGLKTLHPPEQGLIDLTAQYQVDKKRLGWKMVEAGGGYLDLAKLAGPCDYSSFYALCRLESAQLQRVLLLVGSDDGVKVWHNGREVWSNPVVRGALPFEDVVPLDLQPGSNEPLVRIQNATGACGLYLDYRAVGPVVLRLPDKLDTATLAERLKSGAGPGQAQVAKEFLDIDWAKAIAQGDARKGRKLFGSLGCAKCHAIMADADSGGGPSLADARRRFTVPNVVASVLLPKKEVSPVFRATLLVTKQGATLTGLVVSETREKLELLLPDTTRKTLLKSDVEQRTLQNLSPMPVGLIKTPAELRDLLAYLLSDSPAPP
jgi:putative heme-binding domain-containing protein